MQARYSHPHKLDEFLGRWNQFDLYYSPRSLLFDVRWGNDRRLHHARNVRLVSRLSKKIGERFDEIATALIVAHDLKFNADPSISPNAKSAV